jgi:hypothetical protein
MRATLCLAMALSVGAGGAVRAGEASPPRRSGYGRVIRDTANMVHDRRAQALVRKHGLSLINITWEDTGRFKNSTVGPNISDMTIQVEAPCGQPEHRRLTCMPVMRLPNFSDVTADVPIDRVRIRVGNESGRDLRRVTLKEYLGNLRTYLTHPDSWPGGETSLLTARDSHVLVSAQACFLPVPPGGRAEFYPVLFNYQSHRGHPAVLAILATGKGTSATVIDNASNRLVVGRVWGQRLYFNQSGRGAALTGGRASDVRPPVRPDGGRRDARAPGLSRVLLIQVPLRQRRPPLRVVPMAEAAKAADADRAAGRRRSDVESAVIGHGWLRGAFVEIANLPIERDPRYPIRVTVQYYKATSNGVVDESDVAAIRAQIDCTYRDADFVGSLVTEGGTGRPTEHDGPKVEPPGWWDEFWAGYEKSTGESRAAALWRLRAHLGRARFLLVVEDRILLEKKLRELNED